MASGLTEQFETYRGNMLPAMLAVLAGQLGVTAESLDQLGVGWKINNNAWVFPERDADGQIIGLTLRAWDGRKWMVKGSKRGLTFPVVAVVDGYNASRQQWRRVTVDEPCPICGKPDWCGIDGNTTPPRFVRCMRTEAGSVFTCTSGGYIHELIPGTFKPPATLSSPLPASPHPVLVVEGGSDVAAALSLGFCAVGRPSAEGGIGHLVHLLVGRSVAIIGENDAGAGQRGMEKVFAALQPEVPRVVKIMPPEGVKDLRGWYRSGLTADALLALIESGDSSLDTNILPDKSTLAVAKVWLQREHFQDGIPILRKFNGEWYRFNGQQYRLIDEDTVIRGGLYAFLEDKRYKKFTAKGELTLEPFDPRRSTISDYIDALNMECPIAGNPPCWLDGRTEPAPSNIISFANGILDVKAYLAGKLNLIPASPVLFTLAAVPYGCDPGATCPLWLQFLADIFQEDTERIALLQEWFGYNMVADTSQEKLMLFVGRPASGKSTTLEVLQAVLGPDQCAKSSFKALCSEFGMQPLIGKLAIILPDAHVPRQVDAVQALEVIKAIVGRDGTAINRKFLPIMANCKVSGRFTIAVNELPELPDHARALERRLNLLYFPVTFEGREDRSLKDRLPREAPGIAIWALHGLHRLRKNGQFTVPQSSIPVLDEFRRFLTPVAEFISEVGEVGEGLAISKLAIFDAWIAWCRERGIRSGTRTQFGQRLLAQLPGCHADRRTENGHRFYTYEGIDLIPEAKARYLGGRQ